MRPDVPELQGVVSPLINHETRDYEFHDSYIWLKDLKPSTNYQQYVLAVDLSQNLSKIDRFEFRTRDLPRKVRFSLKTINVIEKDLMLKSLSLVAGVPKERFMVTYSPDFSAISMPDLEPEVKAIMEKESLEYEIMILPDFGGGLSPWSVLGKLADGIESQVDDIPDQVSNQGIGETGAEIQCQKQEFTYDPKIIEITTESVNFKGSIHYSGNIYVVIQKQIEPSPTAQQIKLGQNSYNKRQSKHHRSKIQMKVDLNRKYAIWPYTDEIKFTDQEFSTFYTAYFAADRDCDGYYEQIEEDFVKSFVIKTSTVIFKVDHDILVLEHIDDKL